MDSISNINKNRLLPYRNISYDSNDTKYANQVQLVFKYVSPELKNKFQEFTHNLMDDKQISQKCLLDAIEDFKSQGDINLLIKFNEIPWFQFTDIAINYNPYQNCIII